MIPFLAPFIDELGAAAIGRLFLWHRPARTAARPMPRPTFDGDLHRFFSPTDVDRPTPDWSWLDESPDRNGRPQPPHANSYEVHSPRSAGITRPGVAVSPPATELVVPDGTWRISRWSVRSGEILASGNSGIGASAANEPVQFADFHFPSPIRSAFPVNDRVHVRRWFARNAEITVIGLGGLVQLGYYWFDRLAVSMAARGVEFLMMDEPYNHRRTPRGFRPGEMIAGGGPDQLIAAVHQAVVDARALIRAVRGRGRRVAVVGQSYGGWLALILAMVEPDIEFVVPLIPMCDLAAWYRAGLPLSRGARRRFPRFSNVELDELLRPVNPFAWQSLVPGERIDLHAARLDRLVLYRSIERLAKKWKTRFTAHHAGHYSVFFGDALRRHVTEFVCSNGRDNHATAECRRVREPCRR